MSSDTEIVQKYWNALPRFCNKEDQEFFEDLNIGLIESFSRAGHRSWAKSINLWRKVRFAILRTRMGSGRSMSNLEHALKMNPEEEEYVEVTTEELRRSVKYALESSKYDYGTHWLFNGDLAQENVSSASDKRGGAEIPLASKRMRREETKDEERKVLSPSEDKNHTERNGMIEDEQGVKGNNNTTVGGSTHRNVEKDLNPVRDIFDTDDDDVEESGEFAQGNAGTNNPEYDLEMTDTVKESNRTETQLRDGSDRTKNTVNTVTEEEDELEGAGGEVVPGVIETIHVNNKLDAEEGMTRRNFGSSEDEYMHGNDYSDGKDGLEAAGGEVVPGVMDADDGMTRRCLGSCEDDEYIYGNNYSDGKHRSNGSANQRRKVANEAPVRIQELDMKISVIHRGQYISEEDLYGLISDYGEVELMTDAEGGDLEELPVFPSNVWIKYQKEDLNNISNPIFRLNRADLSITHTSYLRIWTHDQELRCFKNISGEQWRRVRWDVVKEADVEGQIEDGRKITVTLKKGTEWSGHYYRQTYVTYTGRKSSCAEGRDSICMENAWMTKTIVVPGRQEFSSAKLQSACVFLTSTSMIELY